MSQRESTSSKQPFLAPDTSFPPITTSPGNPPAYEPRLSKKQRFAAFLPSKHVRHKFWIIEALASSFSIVLFIAIAIILSSYDNDEYGAASALSQQGEMKRPTIFPILSFLSAIMRASMLLPVATAIGQLKWSWFRAPRRLIDMERFDDASRGMTGSLQLLWTVRFRHLAAIGAGLTVLALPIDALIQSTVFLPQQRELNNFMYERGAINVTNTTTFPKTSEYFHWQGMKSSDEPWASTTMINAVKFGISYMKGLGGAISGETVVECPTGYCDFGRYQTLGISYECVDRSDAIEEGESDGYAYLTLPGTDLQLIPDGRPDFEKMLITANSYTEYGDEVFPDTLGPLVVRTALLVDNWKSESAVAMECALFWRLKTATGQVNQTESPYMNETTLPSQWTTNRDPSDKTHAFEMAPAECWINNRTVTKEGNPDLYQEECLYAVGNSAQNGIQSLLIDKIDGLVGDSILVYEDDEREEWNPTNHFITNVWELTLNNKREGFIHDMHSLFSNVALSMSHIVRRHPIIRANGTATPGFTTGYVYRYVFRYQVYWQRLSFPAILVFGSALFVVLTAVLTAGEYDWRRSNLPLLFHGLGDVERQVCGEIKTLGVMEEAAEGMRVKLEDTAEGAKLVGGITAH